MLYRVELHKDGETTNLPDAEIVLRRQWVNTGDPATTDYHVDRYELAGVQDGVAHYEFRERTVV